jgi:hypothetical protein
MTYKNEYYDLNKEKMYKCKCCLYNTSNKSNYNRHLLSTKHKKRTNTYEILTKTNKTSKYVCECGKLYKHRQSLYNHSKKCNINKNNYMKILDESKSVIEEKNNKISMLEKENEVLKLKNEIIRLSKSNEFMKQSFNIEGSFNNNSFNNKNEIKIFLSEHCSNALSIQEFVKQLTISLDDLMKTKDNTVKGITDIIERNLKPLSLTTRPVHHVDKHDWFIKNKEEWNEDDGNTLVDKTHDKIQKEYLNQSEKEVFNDEDYLIFVKNGTNELDSKEKERIKNELLKYCVMS